MNPAPSQDPDEDVAEDLGLSEAKKRSLANLRPPWTVQSAPRHGGRLPSGESTRSVPIRRELERKASKARELRRLVNSWWEAAVSGDSAAREQILKRLDPVSEGPDGAGKIILQALTLVGDGVREPVFEVRHGVSDDLPASSEPSSFAPRSQSESHAGGRTTAPSESSPESPDSSVPAPESSPQATTPLGESSEGVDAQTSGQ